MENCLNIFLKIAAFWDLTQCSLVLLHVIMHHKQTYKGRITETCIEVLQNNINTSRVPFQNRGRAGNIGLHPKYAFFLGFYIRL
jgi:hypothetical protein